MGSVIAMLSGKGGTGKTTACAGISIALASATLVNLNALSNLPKGTEHFMSDLHGEAEAFEHILNNCSGVIREKVDTLFYRTMSEESRRTLCTLIYYPVEKMEELRAGGIIGPEWYRITLYRLVDLSRSVASKYTRAKVRDALPADYQYIIDNMNKVMDEDVDIFLVISIKLSIYPAKRRILPHLFLIVPIGGILSDFCIFSLPLILLINCY